jgi:hypothetical protein
VYTYTASATDPAGNVSPESAPFKIILDTSLPTIAITSDKTLLGSTGTALITFTLTKPSTDFTLSDVIYSGGTLGSFTGSGTSYTAVFTTGPGATQGVISVGSNVFCDSSGNYNVDGSDANNKVTIELDQVPPTIALTSDKTALKSGESATFTFTLSEDSTDFAVGDVTYSGGTLTNFSGSGKVYTATFTPTAGSTTAGLISVASGAFKDPNANANADGSDTNNKLSITVDTVPPTIAITSDKATFKAGESATITFTLSEDSADFALADVVYSNGTLTNFTGSGKEVDDDSDALATAFDKFQVADDGGIVTVKSLRKR